MRTRANKVVARSGMGLLFAALVVLVIGAALPTSAIGADAGQLFAFGLNNFGQLGNTTNNESYAPNPTPTLVTLPGATGPVAAVAASEYHSLALTSTGQLFTFGLNNFGQLGNPTNEGTENPNPTPTLVTLPGAAGPVTQISAGGAHSLVLTTTGQLYAFGSNNRGQLGNPTNEGTENPNPTPTLVTLPGATGPVTQISAGFAYSLALTTTGQLYSFGANQSGQLGNPANNGANPTPTLVTLPGATGPVTQISAGYAHSLVLTTTGQLYAFGSNHFGQLGGVTNSGTKEPNPTPTLVTLPGTAGPVTQISAGGAHSLVLTTTGQFYAFGANVSGQLGNATNNKSYAPNPTPTLITLPGATGPVTQIFAGESHSLVLTSTDQFYGFGDNDYGELSIIAPGDYYEPNPTPTPIGLDARGVAPGSTAYHTLVIVPNHVVTSEPSLDDQTMASIETRLATPVISELRQSHRRWREDRRFAHVSSHRSQQRRSRVPVATTFTFRLNKRAKVRFVFARRKSNGFRKAAVLGFAGHSGMNQVRFGGSISRQRRLKPGRYKMVAIARSGIRQSKPKSIRFTIVR